MAETDIDVGQLIEGFLEGDHEALGRVLVIVIPTVDGELKRFPRVSYACDDVLDHVLGKLKAGRFDTEGATLEQFKAWVRQVAENRLLDLTRRNRCTICLADDVPGGTGGDGSDFDELSEEGWSDGADDGSHCLATFMQVAALHGLIQPILPKGRQVDLYAVYLFEFRRNLYLALRRCAGGRRHNYLHTCEVTVPWNSDGSRAFRPDWPSIERLWNAMSPLISEGQHVDIEHVIERARSLEPDCAATPDVYYNWVRRMRRILELNYDEFANAQEPDVQRAWELWKCIILKPKTT